MAKTKKERTVSARKSANDRWSDYRNHLIDEVRKLATKSQFDFFLVTHPFTKPGAYRAWRETLMELRKQNDLRHK